MSFWRSSGPTSFRRSCSQIFLARWITSPRGLACLRSLIRRFCSARAMRAFSTTPELDTATLESAAIEWRTFLRVLGCSRRTPDLGHINIAVLVNILIVVVILLVVFLHLLLLAEVALVVAFAVGRRRGGGGLGFLGAVGLLALRFRLDRGRHAEGGFAVVEG